MRPLVFGGYGECSDGVRRLINALALETASRRQRREDFDCLNVKQAQGVVAWWITRRWGRMSLLTAAPYTIYRNPRALRPGVEPALIRDRAGVNGNRGWSLAGVVKISS